MKDDIEQAAEELVEDLPDSSAFPEGTTATVEEVAANLEELAVEFSVPLDEAVNAQRSDYTDRLQSSDTEDVPSTSQDAVVNIGDLTSIHDGEYLTVEGTVVQLFELSESQAEYFDLSGVIGDDTGTTTFSIRSEAVEQDPVLDFEEGESYRVEGIKGDEYDGIGLIGETDTSATRIDESFDVPQNGNAPEPDEIETIKLDNLNTSHDEEWLSVSGTVQRELELERESVTKWVSQRVVIGDDTGTAILTIPDDSVEANSGLELEVGESYELDSVVGDAYQDSADIQATPYTTVDPLSDSFEVPQNDTDIMAPLVKLENGSGLVNRCSVEGCSYTIGSGSSARCAEHGNVDGEKDMRLKCVFDDGEQVHRVLFDQAATEALTGISMERATEIANDAMDMEAVADEMEEDIVGHYYTVTGDLVGEYIYVSAERPGSSFSLVETDNLQAQATKLKNNLPPRNPSSADEASSASSEPAGDKEEAS